MTWGVNSQLQRINSCQTCCTERFCTISPRLLENPLMGIAALCLGYVGFEEVRGVACLQFPQWSVSKALSLRFREKICSLLNFCFLVRKNPHMNDIWERRHGNLKGQLNKYCVSITQVRFYRETLFSRVNSHYTEYSGLVTACTSKS